MEVIHNCHIGSYLGVPLILENGTLYGTLCAIDPEPFNFTKEHVVKLDFCAKLIASFIDKMKYDSQPTLQNEVEMCSIIEELSLNLTDKVGNSLQIIKGLFQLKPEYREKGILSEVDEIGKVINELIKVTQPPIPIKTYISVHTLIKEGIQDYKNELSIKNIQFNYSSQENVKCYADFKQLTQVLKVLIRNCIDAIGTNGKIEITATNISNQFIQITFTHNGYEIPASIESKGNSVELGGIFCSKILHAHGGTFNSDSNYKGTVITIKLPE